MSIDESMMSSRGRITGSHNLHQHFDMDRKRRNEFRPCIDLHNGQVKQIIGGTLSKDNPNKLKTNFVARCISLEPMEPLSVDGHRIANPPVTMHGCIENMG